MIRKLSLFYSWYSDKHSPAEMSQELLMFVWEGCRNTNTKGTRTLLRWTHPFLYTGKSGPLGSKVDIPNRVFKFESQDLVHTGISWFSFSVYWWHMLGGRELRNIMLRDNKVHSKTSMCSVLGIVRSFIKCVRPSILSCLWRHTVRSPSSKNHEVAPHTWM